jgi:hypothetical protein
MRNMGRVSKEVRETAKYQGSLAKEAERRGDYAMARKWSDRSRANKTFANMLDADDRNPQ